MQWYHYARATIQILHEKENPQNLKKDAILLQMRFAFYKMQGSKVVQCALISAVSDIS